MFSSKTTRLKPVLRNAPLAPASRWVYPTGGRRVASLMSRACRFARPPTKSFNRDLEDATKKSFPAVRRQKSIATPCDTMSRLPAFSSVSGGERGPRVVHEPEV